MSCPLTPKSRRGWLLLAALPLLIAAMSVAALPIKTAIEQEHQKAAAAGYAQNLSQAFRNAAKEVQPSVVLIKANATVPVKWKGDGMQPRGRSMERWYGEMPFRGLPDIPELKRFFEKMPEMPQIPNQPEMGVGSGVIIDESGVVLTNNHVVDGRNDVTVRLSDGREFKAEEVKSDPATDLAVIRIKGADDLTPAKLGNSDGVEIGDWVLALGHPFGLEGTVTAGIVSAKGRSIGIPNRAAFIQTDAAINPGNSGGPLVNLKGEVIGINTAISSRNGGNQGVGFAIPVNMAKWVSQELIGHGSVRRAQLGVMIQAVTPDLAEQFGLESPEGVLVADVMPDTPAAKAGLKAGDVILEYAGHAVSTPHEVQAAVERSGIGESHAVVVMRDGKRMSLEVTPREAPADVENAGQGFPGSGEHQPSRFEKLGLEVETLTPEVAEHLNVKADHGVVITDVRSGGPADEAGLAAGMVIVQADRKPLNSVGDLSKILDNVKDGVLLLVRSEQGSRFVVLDIGD